MINPYKPWNLRKTPAISSVAQWELQLTEPEQKCGVLLKCAMGGRYPNFGDRIGIQNINHESIGV